MKIIISENYSRKLKISYQDKGISPSEWHSNLQQVIEDVSRGGDVYEAIKKQFINYNFSSEQMEQIKDYVFGALYKDVPSEETEVSPLL